MAIETATHDPELLQRRPRADRTRKAHLGHLQLRRPLGRHVRLHPHLHAGVRPHRRRHELVAGRRHHPARQSHRSYPDAPQRPRGREIRHPVPRLRPRVIRRQRRQCPRGSPRARCLRLVRHSDLDRRPGHLLHARRSSGPRASRFRHLDLLLRLLARQYGRHLERHRDHPLSAKA